MSLAFAGNLGSVTIDTAATNNTLTMTAAAPAGSRIVVFCSYWNDLGSVSGVTVAGTSCGAADKHVANGSDQFDIFSLYSAAGVANGSSIVITVSAVAGSMLAGAYALTGVDTAETGAIVTTSSATGTGTAWSSGAATNTGFADSVYAGGAGNEIALSTTSTATSGTEVHDVYTAGADQGLATGYKIVSSVASDAITGNWSQSGSTANTGGLVIFKSATPPVAAAILPDLSKFPKAILRRG